MNSLTKKIIKNSIREIRKARQNLVQCPVSHGYELAKHLEVVRAIFSHRKSFN